MIALLLAAALSAPPEDVPLLAKDGVITYVTPERVGFGTVEVTVDISAEGKVVSVAPEPLRDITVDAAVHKWRFAPGKPRTETITFIFEPWAQADCEAGTKAWYRSPYTVHVQHVDRVGICLPRVNGAIVAKECELHHVPMTVERLPVTGGLPPLKLHDAAEAHQEDLLADYLAHIKTDFPNAWHFAGGGCTVMEKWMEAYICPRCREVEKVWRDAHPDFHQP